MKPFRDFPEIAIEQHATKTMARVPGVDFRVPTSEELDALEAYINSLSFPADGNFDLVTLHAKVDSMEEASLSLGVHDEQEEANA